METRTVSMTDAVDAFPDIAEVIIAWALAQLAEHKGELTIPIKELDEFASVPVSFTVTEREGTDIVKPTIDVTLRFEVINH